MLKETNMNGVKSVARTFAMLEPKETPYSPIVIMHPFTNSGFVVLKNEFSSETECANIMEDKMARQRWQKDLKERINGFTSLSQVFMFLMKPYRLVFLKHAMPYVSEKDYSENLANAWITEEAPNSNPNFTANQLIALFKQANPKYLMDEKEYRKFQRLGERITVYRGVTTHNADRVKALSWTAKQSKAEWFANRFGEEGMVYQAEISKDHIYAFFDGRNESEIILDPNYLMNLTEVQETEVGFAMTQ